jgi:hypothetical protein
LDRKIVPSSYPIQQPLKRPVEQLD